MHLKTLFKSKEYIKLSSVLLDQFLLSITSFLTTVVLARTLSQSMFANFVLLLSATMFVLGLQRALITQPYAIHLNDYIKSDLVKYKSGIFLQKLAFSGLLFLFSPIFFLCSRN